MVLYLDGQKNVTRQVSIHIDGLEESDIIHKDSVISSKPSVASIQDIIITQNTDTTFYYDNCPETSLKYISGCINLLVHKVGTSVVSFKINDNGKNQYSRFKNKYTTSVTLKKNISKPVISVTAKKNRKIMDIQVHESPKKNTSPVSFTALNYHKGKTSAKFRLNTLKAKIHIIL